MDKHFSAILGLCLILLGGLALMGNMGAPVLGVSLSPFWPFAFLWRETVGRLWPVVVIGLGLLLAAPPVLHPTRRGLGVLFIPALPVLTTGALLLLASLFNWWGLWRWLWPQEVLALALGFLFAAIWMRAPGLAIPAILVGLNGMVFQLCAVTGWWEAWAVLWTIEPLAVGLGLLAAGALARKPGLTGAGLIFCALAGVALVFMTLVLADWWLLGVAGALALILIGFLLVAWGLKARPARAALTLKNPTAADMSS